MPQAVPFLIAAAKALFAKIIVALAVNVAVALAARALTGRTPDPEQGKVPLKQPIPPVQVGFGECRISGPYAFYETFENHTLDVVLLCRGPIEGVLGYWFHDDYVTIAGGGGAMTVDPVTGLVHGQPDADYDGNNIHILHRVGDFPETAYAHVIAASGGRWTADHRLDGIASLGMTCRAVKPEDLQKFYPNGEILVSARARLNWVYDWRLDDTQPGGAGPQRRDDPTTWTWSKNSAVCLIHDEWFNRGQDWDYRFAPTIAHLTAAADVCDDDIPLAAGGTEKRYELSGFYRLNNPPKDLRERQLASMDGMLIERGDGAFLLKAGIYEAPTLVLDEDRILEASWRRSRRREDVANRLVISFNNPDQGFTMSEGEAWLDQDSIDLVGEKSAPFELEWVTSHTQARRLAKAQMGRLKAQYQGHVVIDLSDDEEELEQRWVTIRNRLGPPSMWDVVCEVSAITLNLAERRVRLDLVQADPTLYDWTTAEEGNVPAPPTPPVNGLVPVPVITGLSVFFEDGDVPRVAITITDLERPDLVYIPSWRVAGDATWNDEAPRDGETSGGSTVILTGLVAPGTSVEVRVFAKSAGGTSDASNVVTIDTMSDLLLQENGDALLLETGDFLQVG